MEFDKFMLNPEKLKNYCDPSIFDFETTDEAPSLTGLVGQERAMKSVNFGFNVDKPGYNIYLAGSPGTGKTSYAKAMANDRAEKAPTPSDWCYVFNFKKPEEPKALELPPGEGKHFCKTMRELIENARAELPKALKEQTFEERKAQLVKEFQNKRSKLMDKLNQIGEEYGFRFKHTSSGIVTIPMVEGKEINEEEYEKLDEDKRREIEEKSSEIQVHVMKIIREIREEERELKDKLDNLREEMALSSLAPLMKPLKERYEKNESVKEYLEQVENDILDNLDKFTASQDESQGAMFPFLKTDAQTDDFFLRYEINLLVDNSDLSGAPVIVETNPTFYNLLGKMEYVNKMGTTTTDFTQIKPGALHRANGGFLILQANDLLRNPVSYNALKRVLNTRELRIENMGEQMGVIAVSSLRPEPIPIDLKVLIVGTRQIYQLLYNYEEDFSKLFKIKADFDETMERSNVNVHKMASFIYSHCKEKNLRPFTAAAVAKVIEHSSRLADHQQKLSTRFNDMVELAYESDTWAKIDDKNTVNKEHVERAIDEKVYRSNRPEEKIQELIDENILMIDTREKVIGQVNGLAVNDLGDFRFGKPFRITANTFSGKKGIINIEREAKLSGKIHDKGVMILSSYLGDVFFQEMPFSLSCSLCCEQSYGMIDGDSASSTELYAILSSLADAPIKQNIAVTGSVNQKGEIQPVGGITEKIEGYFATCKNKGFTGNEGVIIPKQNEKNLNLSDEIIDAVKEGKFNVYSITSISEGIEILTELPSGLEDEDPSEDSIYMRAKNQIKEFQKTPKEKEDNKNEEKEEKTNDTPE
ncbi:Lon protease family protein [Natranaerofaba carboxydovora]|uniref:Lon protease family protein n=1 Tax=Natranaerofaba carboxydovora TaxID=2742683 RepID=UPI001F13C960|nr:AAA family ATPase [Natranaerofaba carboxydovora]UMZ75025.1 Lon protease [Natranaerofaba carboxydovora]